jgi:hypothetical protein
MSMLGTVEHVAGIRSFGGMVMVPALPKSEQTLVSRVAAACEEQGIFSRAIRKPEILCAHAGIMDEDTPPFLRSTSAIDRDELFAFMDEFDLELALCGDWHEHKVHTRNGRTIIQVGALVPTGFDNLGVNEYGYAISYDTHTKQIAKHVVPGPRFLKVVYEEQTLDAAWVHGVMSGTFGENALYVKVSALPENMKHARQDLDQMVADGFISGYDLVPSKEMVRVQAKAAATRASSAATFESALEEYLRVTPLPEGATRKGVIEKVSALLTHKRT